MPSRDPRFDYLDHDMYLQRAIYPNGGRSVPFVVNFSRRDMQRAANMVREGTWPEPPGQEREFASGSSRLSNAWYGRFWSTARKWSQEVGMNSEYIGNTPLSEGDAQKPRGPYLYQGELQLLLGDNDEFGYRALMALGIPDVNKYLARSVGLMACRVEEAAGWSGPWLTTTL